MAVTSTAWIVLFYLASVLNAKPLDPCAVVAGKKWVLPRQARACMAATPVNPIIKANVRLRTTCIISLNLTGLIYAKIIEVVNKTLAFHTSVNYQIQAPRPYDRDVHEDLKADLARINQQSYPSDFDLHSDIYQSFKLVNDGHCGVYNYCYDCEYMYPFCGFIFC